MTPRTFYNVAEGYAKKVQTHWIIARFQALLAASGTRTKKVLTEKDVRFEFERKNVALPTKKDTEWMDKHFGRKL